MAEKFLALIFGGILLALFYHPFSAFLLHHFLALSPTALQFWYVPLAVVPALLLLALAWVLGFGRRGSSLWGNLGALAVTAAIVLATIGPPYNCWRGLCF
jgi:hypothetical protein